MAISGYPQALRVNTREKVCTKYKKGAKTNLFSTSPAGRIWSSFAPLPDPRVRAFTHKDILALRFEMNPSSDMSGHHGTLYFLISCHQKYTITAVRSI
jgi:hypothetical protein